MGRERELDPRSSAKAQYGYRLRHYRKRAGLAQEAIAARFNVTSQMIGHIETGRRSATLEMSKGFDAFFELDKYFEELWWHVRREQTPDWFRDYLEAELRASSIRLFDPLIITGILQTEPYAREVLRAGQREDKLEELVSSRMARQEILGREDPPWIVVLLHEHAIREVVGGREMLLEQLHRLLEMAKRPNVTIHVVPLNAPIYPSGSFTLFSFNDQLDLGYVESAAGLGRMIEHSKHVEGLKVDFDLIRSVALPAEASAELIQAVMESM